MIGILSYWLGGPRAYFHSLESRGDVRDIIYGFYEERTTPLEWLGQIGESLSPKMYGIPVALSNLDIN